MINLLKHFHTCPSNLLTSRLYDETTFYEAFIRDLKKCKKEAIIECPFITTKRMNVIFPILNKLVKQKVKIVIVTRDPQEHGGEMIIHAEKAIQSFEFLGIDVILYSGNHHRKVAILDRTIIWEGSLNILSQCYSSEIMRRIQSEVLAREMFDFLKLRRYT
jgi:HKD family nuclease